MNLYLVSRIGFVFFVVFNVGLTFADDENNVKICVVKSIKNLVLISGDDDYKVCSLNGVDGSFGGSGVIEGDETSLQKALSLVHNNAQDYAVVLFYASWCPFSTTFRPSLSLIASLYPSVTHFAIEESVIRPSILSKYGVHGFPTLFVLNSTMRVRYHGSRTLGSLMAFYTNVTGITPESLNETSLGETIHEHENRNTTELENCPFSWARSPENMLQHETYLALATIFVVLRLLYLSYPFIMICARVSWRQKVANIRFRSLWEHPLAYMNRAIQLFSLLTEPCKRSNLHGAMNAKAKAAWASKSLASVSFGEASNSRDGSGN